MKHLNSSFVFVILCNFFSLCCVVSLYGNFKDVSLNNSEKELNLPNSLQHVKNKYSTNSNIIILRSRTVGDSNKVLTDIGEYCMKLYVHNNDTSNIHFEPPENYDTLTQSDIVRKQYMMLPYPAVSDQELANEKIYYDSKYRVRKIPYYIYYGTSFEALNHFLYKGRNNFRLVFK